MLFFLGFDKECFGPWVGTASYGRMFHHSGSRENGIAGQACL